jgi:hypothetical protein
MLGNVLKMASENKITAKNTWSLQLIDHLSDLVKSGEERTNFQRASCTLDAVRASHRCSCVFSQVGALICNVLDRLRTDRWQVCVVAMAYHKQGL